MRVGYQGDYGSNNERVAIQQYRGETLVPLISSQNVVSALLNKQVDIGIMAIHNSIGGVVNETEIAIKDKPLKKFKEVKLPIHHCLCSKECSLGEITTIISHPQALAQTAKWCEKNLKSTVVKKKCDDQAKAAKEYAKEPQKGIGIICSKGVAQDLSLNILAENIEDEAENITTFGLFSLI